MSSFSPSGTAGDGGAPCDAAADAEVAPPNPPPASSPPPLPAPTAFDTRSVEEILRKGGLPSVEELQAELERQGLPDAVPLVIEAAVKRPPSMANPDRIIPPRPTRALFAPLADEPIAKARPYPDGPIIAPLVEERAAAPDVVELEQQAEPEAVEPVAAEPIAAEPMTVEPMTAEPMTVEPEPAAVEPITVEPEPAAVEPEPVAAEPITVEPITVEPVAAEAVADDGGVPAAVFTTDEPGLAAMIQPVLPVAAPRATRAAVAATVVQRPAPAVAVRPVLARQRRRRGAMAKALITLILLGALAAAAVFVMQRFVLAKAWPAELKPVATFVEGETGFSFDHSVPVRVLPGAEFAVRASSLRLDHPEGAVDAGAADRAVGLFEGSYDELSGARAAAGVWPALYDPASGAVYVDASVPSGAERDAYIARELVLALYHQAFDWPAELAELDHAQRVAYRAGLEGEAAVVATAWQAKSRGGNPASARESELVQAPPAAEGVWRALPATYGFESRVATGLGPVAASAEEPAEGKPPVEPGHVDAHLYGWDAEKDASGLASMPLVVEGEEEAGVEIPGPRGTMGAGWWFAVLASRLDAASSWIVASTWAGDQAVTLLRDDQVCVKATVRTVDTESLDLWEFVLTDWVARGPAASGAAVTRTGGEVMLASCDPGIDADTRAVDDPVGLLVALAAERQSAATATAETLPVEN
ncbi:MAG: hypothetical protein IPM43_06500 [Actinomycetota bacterium]|nr:MAG: hypothetical protein IPM43_06500 [Actinomycetota bacterium]